MINDITKDTNNCVNEKSIISEKPILSLTSTLSSIKQISSTKCKKIDKVVGDSPCPSQKEDSSKSDIAIESSSSEKLSVPNISAEEVTSLSMNSLSSANTVSVADDCENIRVISGTYLKDNSQEIHGNSFSPEYEPKLPNNSPDLDYGDINQIDKDVGYFLISYLVYFFFANVNHLYDSFLDKLG